MNEINKFSNRKKDCCWMEGDPRLWMWHWSHWWYEKRILENTLESVRYIKLCVWGSEHVKCHFTVWQHWIICIYCHKYNIWVRYKAAPLTEFMTLEYCDPIEIHRCVKVIKPCMRSNDNMLYKQILEWALPHHTDQHSLAWEIEAPSLSHSSLNFL